MSTDPGGGRRTLVEHAVRLQLNAAPPGWTLLHIECLPLGEVTAFARVAGAMTPHRLTVPPEAAQGLHEYLRVEAGTTQVPQQLVIDCFPDGRLLVRTEPAPALAPGPTPGAGRARAQSRWPKRLLIAVTTGCLVAAAALFAFGWHWSDPPEADISLLPPPSPRQQQAFDTISQWFTALNSHDTVAIQPLVCPTPSGAVLNDVEAINGNYLGSIDYPEAIVDFRDNGATVSAKVLLRVKPITDDQRLAVKENQQEGSGLAHRWIVLVDDGGVWKVCGSE